jgi:predicted Zn-ribbon and HTH transcriptional regulator
MIVRDVEPLKCNRCGHSWFARQVEVRVCPKCHSIYFDRPRKEPKEIKNDKQEKAD